jgi:ClpP class serine protease
VLTAKEFHSATLFFAVGISVGMAAVAINPIDILWFYLILSSLQPVINRRWLEVSRQRLIADIERQRGSRVILLVHRQETMSLLGFPVLRYIDINDSEEILRAVDLTEPRVPIDLVLHTPGGLVLAATQIAVAIAKHQGKVTVFVPHYAMSGGTLIALAADEIIMSEHAVLGPIDPQIGEYPAVSILRVVQEKPIEEVDDRTLILADQARKAIGQLHDTVYELIKARYSPEQADNVARLLSEGTWTHDYPITFERAKELGLPVNSKMPRNILNLMALYPQPVRQYPSVEYLPTPASDGRREPRLPRAA